MSPHIARVAHLAAAIALAMLATGQSGEQPGAQSGEAAPQGRGDTGFEGLSLEQLMEVPVDVGSRHAEPMAKTAASVFVLNEPEIRRSGMRSVPELLRLVPGLIIAQDVPGAYGFSSRLGEYGFSGMLVLIDGQRLYTTLLRREYWQAIDLPVEIVERIEVVRGPGGARWGDKASQGVINIVTKKAKAAQGGQVTGVVGTEEHLIGSVRYGDRLGDATDFYVYGKLAQRDGGYPTTAGDRWDNNSIGTRIDSELAPGVDLAVEGLYHDSFIGDSFLIDPGFSSLNMIEGGHVTARLRVDHGDGEWSEARLAGDGYDQDIRDYRDNVPDEFLRFREELFELGLQHGWTLAADHQLTIGASVRSLTVENFLVFAGTGNEFNETRGDVFAAWDWDISDEVRLTLGGNVGYQDARTGSGVDVQPDVRLAWTPDPDFTLWTAVSANREPDIKVEDAGVLVRRDASDLLAYELGVRRRFGESLLLQVDTFYYFVDDQLNGFATDPVTGATLFLTGGETRAFGGEIAATWNPAQHVRVTGFLATTEANTRDIDETTFLTIEDQVPRLRGGMTAGFDPVPGIELDTNVFYTQQHIGIPTWWRVDLRAAWRPTKETSIELVGQNLTDPQHPEYFFQEQVQRGVYFMVTTRF